MNIDSIVCDEMIDPVVDEYLESNDVNVVRPQPSDSDAEVLKLAKEHKSPILTRDRDFVAAHRDDREHYGIIFDPGMHHRPPREVLSALDFALDLLDEDDLKSSVIWLKKFY